MFRFQQKITQCPKKHEVMVQAKEMIKALVTHQEGGSDLGQRLNKNGPKYTQRKRKSGK